MKYVSYPQLLAIAAVAGAAPWALKKLAPKKAAVEASSVEQKPEVSPIVRLDFAVLVIADVKMAKGKTCAQVGHAAAEMLCSDANCVASWRAQGCPTTVWQVADLDACEKLVQLAHDSKLTADIICDAGHTQVAPGTVTVGWVFGERYLLECLLEGQRPLE